jgi:peroxiredoxin
LNPGLKKRLTSPLAILIAFLVVINVIWIIASSLKSETLPEGTPAPDFELPVAGRPDSTFRLSQLRGQRSVVLVFWATWCSACRSEMASLAGSASGFDGDLTQLVGVNLDFGEEAKARSFLKMNKIRFTNLLADGEVAERYRVTSMPALYVIGKDGKVCWAGTGYTRASKLAAMSRKCAGSSD